MEAAAARMARVKEDPRERPKTRALIARAEALLMEASAAQRNRIEEALDLLESDLRDRDPEWIQASARHLVELCESMDGGEAW